VDLLPVAAAVAVLAHVLKILVMADPVVLVE
jgi:hypothetical protein